MAREARWVNVLLTAKREAIKKLQDGFMVGRGRVRAKKIYQAAGIWNIYVWIDSMYEDGDTIIIAYLSKHDGYVTLARIPLNQ